MTTFADLDVLARTIYGEARGETLEGQIAVAHVILNRTRKGGWWGSTVAAVCRHPYQFSCWNDGDPNRALLTAVTLDDPDLRDCAEAALTALGTPDTTGAATHYYRIGITPPAWAAKATRTRQIGAHLFYRNVP